MQTRDEIFVENISQMIFELFFNSSSKRKKTFLFQQLCVPPIHRIEYIILYRDVQIFVSFLLRCSNSPRGSAIEVSGRVHKDN